MKILLLTPDIPYPSESGAAIRNWGIISGLAAASHKVTLLSFADRVLDAGCEPLLERCSAVHSIALPKRRKGARLIQLITSNSADMESRLASRDFETVLRKLLRTESFDIVQFSGLELGGYLDAILAEKRAAKLVYDALNAEVDLQRVIASVDSESLRRLPAALYSRAQASRLARFEARVCRGVDACIAVSDEDRALLQRYAGAPITVMSNGIHVEDYRPLPENRRAGNNSSSLARWIIGRMSMRSSGSALTRFLWRGSICRRFNSRSSAAIRTRVCWRWRKRATSN